MSVWNNRIPRLVGFIILVLTLISGTAAAQQNKTEKIELADEYFKRGNFEKALEIYEEIKGNLETDKRIFTSYLSCLDKLKPGKADAASRKFMKRYPDEPLFFINHYKRLKAARTNPEEIFQFARTRLQAIFLKSSGAVRDGCALLAESGDTLVGSGLLEEGIRRFGLAGLWDLRLDQLLNQKMYAPAAAFIGQLLSAGIPDVSEIQSRLQEKISVEVFTRELQVVLLKRIQTEPAKTIYPSFLAWISMQKGDYTGALRQNLALDLLESNGGIRCYQLGEFAVNASENKAAIQCFESIIREFPQSQYRFMAQQKCMQLKEQFVKNTFPIQQEEVRQLIRDYRELSFSQYLNVYELTMKIAELYGKYLNRPDSAILELENSMKTIRWQTNYLNQAKILLADMYLLKDEPWEASLLYGQVEKDEAESLTGYEAKLKNAKVFYFKGEFDLCKEILDVLKQSTSRDISNDAIELGLLIQDILAEDTTGFILSKFAEIDLLTFQGNYPESVDRIEKMLFTSPNPVVVEKLRFRLFKNYQVTRQSDKALAELEQIYKAKASDLYLDDALYFAGIIYAEQKKDKDKAMEYFLNLIKEKPGSVYVSDARKRLRQLRGDFAN